MKTIVHNISIILSILIINNSSLCQGPENINNQYTVEPSTKVYGSLGSGIPFQFYASMTYVHKSNFGANILLKRLTERHETSWSPLGPPPDEELNVVAFHFVKQFDLGAPSVRLNLEAGPSINWYTVRENYQKAGWGLFGGLQTYDEENTNAAGLSLRLKLEFPFLKTFGLELAGMANINSARPVYGLEIGFNFGLLRGNKVPVE
jgi:hypothetical protein